MSGTPGLDSSEPGGPEEAGDVSSHLLVADDVLTVGPQSSSYVAVCGVEVDALSGGGEDPGYCPECVRAALRWRATGLGLRSSASGVA